MTEKAQAVPDTQYAVQLIGPSELRLNTEKEVYQPGPTQVLAKVEAVGLCFSDLKLLKQFTGHARKSEIKGGLTQDELAEIPSYVPGEQPTVPGHECVCRIVAVGDQVKHHKVDERCIVQADYRALPTAAANAAFGYNFEGALQEYVLLDERVVVDPHTGERYLIPAGDNMSASAVALVEPWACVEDSYVNPERQTIKAGGKLLVMADAGREVKGVSDAFSGDGAPEEVTVVAAEESQVKAVESLGIKTQKADEVASLPDEAFDDIVYFGTDKATIEALNDKLASRGIINIVTGGGKIGELVNVGVGRVHYGLTRWIGTQSDNASESYSRIPAHGELRKGDKVAVIGAGGPMGQMHVIRNVCSGIEGISIIGTDFDESRLESLMEKAGPMAESNSVSLKMVNPEKEKLQEKFNYYAIMAPVGALVADAIVNSAEGCLINIFAGIPAPVKHEMDLDTYIANRCFMFGTSGSVIEDMKIVLRKVESGQLNTNASVDAVCGMAGATEGIKAVENRTMAGKIIVYPSLRDMGLIPLSKLQEELPEVAARLEDGSWSQAAEEELLRSAAE